VAAPLLESSGALGVTALFMAKRNVKRSVYWFPSSRVRGTLAKEGAKGFAEDEMV